MTVDPTSLTVNVASSLSRPELSDSDLVARLKNSEDSTVERKTTGDLRDCRKTAVAFSNSLPVDDPGIIFVGVRDDGTVEGIPNPDSIQKKVSEEIKRIYPPIHPQMKVLKDDDGKQFLAVIVRGSQERPHFAGPAYVRDGSRTKEASDPQFARLIAERSGKVREILKWKSSQITLLFPSQRVSLGSQSFVTRATILATVLDCNQFHVTLQISRSARDLTLAAIPLSQLEISFDPDGAGRLCLIVPNGDFCLKRSVST